MATPVNPDLLNEDIQQLQRHLDERTAQDRTFWRQISRPPRRFYLTTMLIMAWGVIILALSPMLAFWLPDPAHWLLTRQWQWEPYTFQIPLVLWVTGILGRRLGLLTVALYLFGGIIAGQPWFAQGGGLAVISSPAIGLLFGFILAPFATQKCLMRAFSPPGWLQGRSLWIVLAAVVGVTVLHTAGAIGLVLHGLSGTFSWAEALAWFKHISWPMAFYDVVFSSILLSSVRLCRGVLWYCLY